MEQLEGLVGLKQPGVPEIAKVIEIEVAIDIAENDQFRVLFYGFHLGTVELKEVL